MKNRFLIGLCLALAIAAVAIPSSVWAQSNIATGQIIGVVGDASGGMLPGAAVQATNTATGLNRRAITGENGFYRIDLLPPGAYDLRVDLSGFNTSIMKGVRVALGSSVQIDVTMELSAVEEEIIVTAEAPVVEVTNPSVTSSVSDEAIANLPLNGRDFLDFVALTPGSVAGSEDEVDGGRGGININGMRGIQNSFNIDGSNSQSSFFGEERGGTRPPFSFSQAAIKEFQVLNSTYNLQFGNASGGIINAITKSGTNDFSGEVFFFYRPDSWVSDYADERPKENFKRNQFGFTLGGPITRDKVHYFVSYDGQRLDQPRLREWRNFPAGMEDEWEQITGLDIDNEWNNNDETSDGDTILLKLDWQISDSHLLTLRDNWNKYEGQNGTTPTRYRTTTWSNNGLEKNKFNSFVATLNSVLSDSLFNEAVFQYALEERPRFPNQDTLPETRIASGYDAAFGQTNFHPSGLDEERFQFIDNLTIYSGDHAYKVGANLDLVSYENFFCRYCHGHYYFRGWDEFFGGEAPRRYIQAFSDSNGIVDFETNYYSFYAQDEWRVNPNLTFSYGIRYDYQEHDDPANPNPLFPATGNIPNDSNNWAPRVGFAWDINGDGKQVLRGGAGYFYDNSPTLLDANALLNNGVNVILVWMDDCDDWDDPDPCPTYPNTYNSIGDLPGSRPSIFVFNQDFESPETLRMSLGYEREIWTDLSVGVDLIYSETKHLERKRDLNLAPDGGTTIDGRPTYMDDANYANFDKVMEFVSDAEAEYKAIVLKARKRFSNGWMLDGSYTYARAEDNDSNERSVSSSSSFPEDQYNLDADWSWSNFDIRHKFVVSATFMLPWDISLSSVIKIRSGFPFTAGDGRDHNDDGYYNDRAVLDGNGQPGTADSATLIHLPRNSERQPWRRTVDMRVAKTFRLFGDSELEIIAEVFNLFNHDNFITTNTQLVEEQWWIGQVVLDPDYNVKDISGAPRQYQLGVKLRF